MSDLGVRFELPAELVGRITQSVLDSVRDDLEARDPAWPEWMRDVTAAAYADVAERTIKRWRRSGQLPYSPVGGVSVIRRVDLDEFLVARASTS